MMERRFHAGRSMVEGRATRRLSSAEGGDGRRAARTSDMR